MDGSLPTTETATGWRPDGAGRVALVLQGGGALGAYQAGVYEALHEAGIEPDWVSGVSIGAINAAIIAGNPPERRARAAARRSGSGSPSARSGCTRPTATSSARRATPTSALDDHDCSASPGFFAPRIRSTRGCSPPGATRGDQLLRHRAAARDAARAGRLRPASTPAACRFSRRRGQRAAPATSSTSTTHQREIGPEHVMASGALPPALPTVKIGSEYFWDGGIVSNTPLQHLLDAGRRRQHAGVPGRPVQRPRPRCRATIQDVMGAAQGHHVLLAHALEHRRLPAPADAGRTRLRDALVKVPEADADRRGTGNARRAGRPARRSPSSS